MISNAELNPIFELDLDPIKAKLMHKESGEGWTQDKVDAIEREYRRFLYLMKVFPHEETAPLVDVDTFWHYHILDTMKYAADCDMVFGHFLHHYPYVGLHGESDQALRHSGSERMRELYEETFGESYLGAASHTGAQAVAAYCVRASEAAYCVRAVGTESDAPSVQASYCVRAGSANDAPSAQASYCVRAAGPENDTPSAQASYCVRAAKAENDALPAQAAYCVRAQPKPRSVQGFLKQSHA